MSTQTNFSHARRNFLKSTAAISALSVGGLTFAGNGALAVDDSFGSGAIGNRFLGDGNIRIIQETLFDREKVTLINESGKLQMLDARQPVSLYQINGALLVTVNQDDEKAVNGMILMSPEQRWTFDVKAIGIEMSNATASNHMDMPVLTNLAENELQITSKYSVFNRIVPVQIV